MLSRRVLLTGSSALLLSSCASGGLGRKSEYFTDFRGRSLHGYDSVAYHQDRKAVRGDETFEEEWKGVRWRFANAENRDLFVANPERWAPQYGGYCAWGVAARNMLLQTDPLVFRIFDDKLYLNRNLTIHRTWLGNYKAFIADADENWPGLVNTG
ncbi:MAG: YHS domain-containing (seleno)protein [Pseudomonadota bacterium]